MTKYLLANNNILIVNNNTIRINIDNINYIGEYNDLSKILDIFSLVFKKTTNYSIDYKMNNIDIVLMNLKYNNTILYVFILEREKIENYL